MIKVASVVSEKEEVPSEATKVGAAMARAGSDERILQDDELDAVGGGVVIAIISVLVG